MQQESNTNFNVACAVLLYNRPRYSLFTLSSLASNNLADDVAWGLFIDGPRNDQDAQAVDEVTSVANCFNTALYSVFNEHNNMGIPYQKHRAQQLFDAGYDQVIFFEDDMVVSPFYIDLILSMQRQFPNDVVYAPARPIRDGVHPVPGDAQLHHVQPMPEHLWGYSMTKETYSKIKSDYEQYLEFFTHNKIDYRKRPHELITRTFGIPRSSHDAFLDSVFEKHGIRKIGTVIPRGRYIGKEGMHQTPENFNAMGFDHVNWYEGEDDAHIDHFEFYNKSA